MKLWRPEHAVVGPQRPEDGDIVALNRIFADAFTDRYRRDGLVGVRVPPLNAQIWRYALQDAGEGAMVWRDEDDQLVAFNIAHRSGLEGWMGPLAVRPDRQGLGLGKAIVQAAIDWLRDQELAIIGLETMPRTVENIGFYSRLGFVPGYLTVTLTGDVPATRPARPAFVRLGDLAESDQSGLLQACRERLARSAPGSDYTREHELTADLKIGDTIVLEGPGGIEGFALWHSAPLAEARPAEELRVLKLFAATPDAFGRLVAGLEQCAAKLRIRRVAIRAQTVYAEAYRQLVDRGYRVRWTDLRMSLAGHPEPQVPDGEVLFSNWEI